MRAKLLSAVYAAIGVQRFILSSNPTFSSVAEVAWIVTQAVVVAGASILASDATGYLVDKARTVLFDQPLAKRRGVPPSTPAAPATAPSSTAASTQSAKEKERGAKGEVVSTLASVAEADN